MKPESNEYPQKSGWIEHRLFDELYQKYKSMIYSFAYYLTQNQREAEDLFQETWVRVVQNFPKALNRERCKAWLLTITANFYRDTLRKKRVRRLFFLRKFKEFKDNQGISNFEPEPMKPKKRDKLKEIDMAIAISQALAKLPDRQRLVFILKEIEGFQQTEISEVLRMPLGTVKSLMYRAVRHLRRYLYQFINPIYLKRG